MDKSAEISLSADHILTVTPPLQGLLVACQMPKPTIVKLILEAQQIITGIDKKVICH